MKKLLALVAALIILTGCSDAYTNISNANETLITIGDKSLTNGEVYKSLMSSNPSAYAITDAQKIIADNLKPVTEDMQKKADEVLESYKTMLGDSFEAYLPQLGYATEEAFKEGLLLNVQLEEIAKDYINSKFDELAVKYVPTQIKIMTFSSEETANTAHSQLESGTDFDTVAKDNKSSSQTGNLVVTNQENYPTEVLIEISSLEKGAYTSVIADDKGSTFYIVQLIDDDVNNYKEDAITKFLSISDITAESNKKMFEDANFNVYDKTLYDAIKKNYPDYLN